MPGYVNVHLTTGFLMSDDVEERRLLPGGACERDEVELLEHVHVVAAGAGAAGRKEAGEVRLLGMVQRHLDQVDARARDDSAEQSRPHCGFEAVPFPLVMIM